MTDPFTAGDDLPRRWPDDSPEEDAAAHQAREVARFERWMAEQKTRPLRDLLGEPEGQGYAGPLILPDWWDQIPEPGHAARGASGPESQRPALSAARPAPPPPTRPPRGPGGRACAPARRLHIAARYRTDPWSGRRVAIYKEGIDVDPEGQVSSGQSLYTGCPPDGIYWKSATAR